MKVGALVIVYDRYRFAIPLRGTVVRKAKHTDGIEVELIESNSYRHKIGSTVWVHKRQVKKIKAPK